MKTSSTIYRVPCLLGALLANLSAQVPQYNVVNLGGLGGEFSAATSINNRGQVVGASFNGEGRILATLFSGTGANNINLGAANTSGTQFENSPNWSIATSINDYGVIVGAADQAGYFNKPLIFSGTGTDNISILAGVGSGAYSINNSGQIVGVDVRYDEVQFRDRRLAAKFSQTAPFVELLGALGGTEGAAYSQNHLGQVVGWGETNTGIHRAALFNGSGNIDLGTLGGLSSEANDINEAGQIVGWAKTSSGITRATIFSGTGNGNIDLGSLDGFTSSRATAINNSGQIVGLSGTTADDGLSGLRRAQKIRPVAKL